MIQVSIINRQRKWRPNAEKLRTMTRRVLRGEGILDAAVTIVVVDDPTISKLHGQYLGVASATDVLTFPLSEPGSSRLWGEVVVSAETARRVAQSQGHSVQAELTLYVLHGILHLCGYDDRRARDRKRMRARERHYLQTLAIHASPPTG